MNYQYKKAHCQIPCMSEEALVMTLRHHPLKAKSVVKKEMQKKL
jgi:hypothetical protein